MRLQIEESPRTLCESVFHPEFEVRYTRRSDGVTGGLSAELKRALLAWLGLKRLRSYTLIIRSCSWQRTVIGVRFIEMVLTFACVFCCDRNKQVSRFLLSKPEPATTSIIAYRSKLRAG